MKATRMLLGAVLIAATPLHVRGQQVAEAIASRVDGIFERWTANTPGCAVGVSQNGALVLGRAYGMADLEHDVRNSPQTIFEAGSVSKQFTAAAIILLALDGKLSLDDDVRKFLPELPVYEKPITIRHLINHTSGLRDWGSVAGISGWGRGSRVHTHAHVVDILSRQRALNFTPGDQYSYSNSGYNLQAVIVERVSGMSFAEFSRTRLFEPIGLEHTQWRDDYTRIVKGRAQAYSARGNGFATDMPFENVHGNGGLLTTVEDLLIWTQNLETGRVGGPRFLELMHQQGVLNNGSRITYASGLVVDAFNTVPEISHTGSTAGYRAFLARYPQQKLGVALLCNIGTVNPGAVGQQVAALFLPQPVTSPAARPTGNPQNPVREPVRPTAEQLNSYIGEYYSPDAEVTFNVVVENGTLFLRRRPNVRMSLQPTATPDSFNGGGLGTVRFVKDNSGRVTELSISQARVFDLRFSRVR